MIYIDEQEKKKYMKEYYIKNKELFKERSKKQHNDGYHKEMNITERRIKQLKYIKSVNYKYEKTPEQRKVRSIKRKTRYHFPLNNNTKCELCTDSAECHHHNTNPIRFDKFNFFCNNCHNGIHTQLNIIGGKRK